MLDKVLSSMNRKIHLFLLIISVSVISGACGAPGKRPVCGCICPTLKKLTVCDIMSTLVGEVHANVEQLRIWTRYRSFVERFSRNWREEIADVVETTIKDYISSGKLHGKTENYADKEDWMLNDSTLVAKPIEEDGNLAKNVSTLIEKVEMMENRTMVVENELKTERRVRRDLEEKVNKTHSSLALIEDHLMNASSPVDDLVTQVEMKLHSSIEDLNKTIYEDHLKNLYYKVDGVAYKNETKKLNERLENIEGELHGNSSVIVAKFAGELRNLEQNLYLLNNSIEDVVVPSLQTLNSSLGDVLVPRIETLEMGTVRKHDVQGLEDKMNSLINETELFKIALVDVLSSTQDIANLEKKFQNFTEQLKNSLETIQKQIEDLKNETLVKHAFDDEDDAIGISRIVQQTTEDFVDSQKGREIENFHATKTEHIAVTETETNDIAAFENNDIITEYQTATEEQTTSKTEMDNIPVFENNDIITEYQTTTEEQTTSETEMDNVAEIESNHITIEYQTTSEEQTTGTSGVAVFENNDITEYQTTTEEQMSSEPSLIIDEDRGRIGKESDNNSTDCDVPVINDPRLLIHVQRNEDGQQILKFGCKLIGRYIVPITPVPPRCENGLWRIPTPGCIELPSETDIIALAEKLLPEHPCIIGDGEFPDPTNCSQFFKCAHGRAYTFPCPHGLLFNPNLKICDFPRAVECFLEKSEHVEELHTLIPPIHIDPDKLDKKFSLLATGETGELIVHPRSSFTLHCLYPDSMYGDPKWNVTYLRTGVNSRVLTPKKSDNRVSLTVTAAKEEDSGNYRCVTPFGLHHDVEVIVKAVVCPALPEEDDFEDVYYRPTPEGESRILGTTAEVRCEEGHSVVAQCMANGEWYAEGKLAKECTPKKRKSRKMWNCEALDLSQRPHLIAEKFDDEKIVAFKCAGRTSLLGSTFTRCLDDDSWSHMSLPHCKD